MSDYPPRNHIPWAILSACWFATAVLLLVTRAYLSLQNKKRDKEEHDTKYDEVFITHVKEDGTKEEVKVDKVCSPLLCTAWMMLTSGFQEFLDLTDGQNRDFRYVL